MNTSQEPIPYEFDSVAWVLGGLRGIAVGPADDEHPFQSEGTTVKLKDATLWHAFNQRSRIPDMKRFHAHYVPTVIAKVESKDGGRSWSAPETLFESNTGMNASHPAIRRLPNGQLGATYQRIDTVSVEEMNRSDWLSSVRTANKIFRYSTDEGKTWSDEIVISPTGGYWTSAHDRLLVLSSGRLIQPLHTHPDKHPDISLTKVARSDDNGLTWQLGEQFLEVTDLIPGYRGHLKSNFHEVAVAERANGSLFMIGRTSAGWLYTCESNDQGETWARPKRSALPSAATPANVVTVPGSDDLLLIWNRCCVDNRHTMNGHRLTLSSAISEDDGLTWKYVRDIESIAPPDPPSETGLQVKVCYPSILIDEERVYLGYWAGALVDGVPRDQQYMAVLPLSWFYAMRDYHRRAPAEPGTFTEP